MLSDVRAGVGQTVFDWLIEIIRDHGPGGEQAEDNVRIVLDCVRSWHVPTGS